MYLKPAIPKDAFLRESVMGGNYTDQMQEKRANVHLML